MAQLPCIGLSWPLTKPPFGSCAIYFHYGVIVLSRERHFLRQQNQGERLHDFGSGIKKHLALFFWWRGQTIEPILPMFPNQGHLNDSENDHVYFHRFGQALQPIIVQLCGVVNKINVNFVCTLIFENTTNSRPAPAAAATKS